MANVKKMVVLLRNWRCFTPCHSLPKYYLIIMSARFERFILFTNENICDFQFRSSLTFICVISSHLQRIAIWSTVRYLCHVEFLEWLLWFDCCNWFVRVDGSFVVSWSLMVVLSVPTLTNDVHYSTDVLLTSGSNPQLTWPRHGFTWHHTNNGLYKQDTMSSIPNGVQASHP